MEQVGQLWSSNLDPADVLGIEPGLVGDRAHDVARLDAVLQADLDPESLHAGIGCGHRLARARLDGLGGRGSPGHFPVGGTQRPLVRAPFRSDRRV
ncbi:MAG: hypothetical protein R3E68_15010 [Burkholderiaceae bacterium]